MADGDEPCTNCVMRGFNPVDVNPMDYGDEILRCPHCGGSGIEPKGSTGG